MRKIGWVVMTALAMMIAAYAMAVLVVPAMRPPFLQQRFLTLPLAAFLHLFGSAIALAIGPFQLNSRLRNRFIDVHRWMGRTYVILSSVAGPRRSCSRPCHKKACRRMSDSACWRRSGF